MGNPNYTFIVSAPGRAKMSVQAAIGYKNWADDDSRQTKWSRGKAAMRAGRSKKKTLRTHRIGK